jgi:hypothetical protein
MATTECTNTLDLLNEEPLSLTDACRALPQLGGRRLHPSSVWRWCRRGIRGVRLEHARLGHRVVTTREALARFAARLAEQDAASAASETAPTVRSTCRAATREKQVQAARERCDDAGL